LWKNMYNAASLRANNIAAGSLGRVARRESSCADYAIATAAVGVLALLSMWWSEAVAHWFLLPVMACGILSGVDIVRWLRGRLDLFDPKTVIACLAFYGFFVAPILHVIWDRFGVGYDLLLFGDWRPWLGAMAALCALGLSGYRAVHNFAFSRTSPSATSWEFDPKKFFPVFAFFLVLSVAGAAVYLWQLGGVLKEVESFETDPSAFVGKGWLLVFAWPLSILSFIVLVMTLTNQYTKIRRHLTTALLLLSAVGIMHFLLMGWRGSRSATIWALFWMAGIIHYRFRKLSRGMVAGGIILLILFMYFYGFYKEQGRAGFEVLRSPAMWLQPRGYQRDFKGLLLGDLARADSNAFILHNLIKDPADYDYRWGLTYVGSLAVLIPKFFWPDRPEFKVEAGTEAQLGKATPWRSARVYGLAGEALLNFGPLGVPYMFALYGGLLGWYRRKMGSWTASDSRKFLAPFFATLFVAGLVSDSDNLVFAVITEGTLVLAAVFLASKRHFAVQSPYNENSCHH
jgi:hypothetical protein